MCVIPTNPSIAENSQDFNPTCEVPSAAVCDEVLSESICRNRIYTYRTKMDWMIGIPQWESSLELGMSELHLPLPRKGVHLRAALNSLLLEQKYALLCLVVDRYKGGLTSDLGYALSEKYGLSLFQHKELDACLSNKQWMCLQSSLRSALVVEHRRYKQAQSFMFSAYHSCAEKLSKRLIFDPSKRQDGYQEACLGLIRAIDKVDASECSFKAYAMSWVKRSIRNYLMREHFPVNVPVNLASQLLSRASGKRSGSVVRQQSSKVDAFQYLLKPRVYIDGGTSAYTEGDEILTLLQLSDEASAGPLESADKEDLYRNVRAALTGLSDKQREVIQLRYGLSDSKDSCTITSIAEDIGITHQQVSQRMKRALLNLKTVLKPFKENA